MSAGGYFADACVMRASSHVCPYSKTIDGRLSDRIHVLSNKSYTFVVLLILSQRLLFPNSVIGSLDRHFSSFVFEIGGIWG